MSQLSHVTSRVLFAAALAAAAVAVWEKLANLFGYTLDFVMGYAPSRLLELSVTALLFVIVLQLREIKEIGQRGDPE
ncbi:hypothetical protein ACFL3S_08980 [Gemmatimonadota bacterium]